MQGPDEMPRLLAIFRNRPLESVKYSSTTTWILLVLVVRNLHRTDLLHVFVIFSIKSLNVQICRFKDSRMKI
jgi:hypothetical protein